MTILWQECSGGLASECLSSATAHLLPKYLLNRQTPCLQQAAHPAMPGNILELLASLIIFRIFSGWVCICAVTFILKHGLPGSDHAGAKSHVHLFLWWLGSEDRNCSQEARLIAGGWVVTCPARTLQIYLLIKSQLCFSSRYFFLSLPNTLLLKNLYHQEELSMIL